MLVCVFFNVNYYIKKIKQMQYFCLIFSNLHDFFERLHFIKYILSHTITSPFLRHTTFCWIMYLYFTFFYLFNQHKNVGFPTFLCWKNLHYYYLINTSLTFASKLCHLPMYLTIRSYSWRALSFTVSYLYTTYYCLVAISVQGYFM